MDESASRDGCEPDQLALREALLEDGESKSFDHYGREHVARVLGLTDMARLSNVVERKQGAWFVPARSSDELTGVVVGFHRSAAQPRPAVVLLAGRGADMLESGSLLTSGELVSAELMRVRSGLMRKETAERLVAALLGWQVPLADEDLEWAVVDGPSKRQSVRSWLDQWPGVEEMLLRRVVGCGLPGGLADTDLTMLCVVRSARLRHEQAFAYGSPLVELPPRYRITGFAAGGQNGLPPEYEVWVDRADTDERALELAGRLEVAGLLTGLGARGSRSDTARLAEVADSLWPQFDVGCRSPDAAPSYARSFAEDEVRGVVQALEREGIRGLRVRDWRVEPPVSSNPYYDGMEVRQRDHEQLLELVVHGKDNRELPFGVRLWSCTSLPLHLPESEWPAWALESKAMIEREVAEQEWQHREQIHAYLEEFDAAGTAEA